MITQNYLFLEKLLENQFGQVIDFNIKDAGMSYISLSLGIKVEKENKNDIPSYFEFIIQEKVIRYCYYSPINRMYSHLDFEYMQKLLVLMQDLQDFIKNAMMEKM